MRASVFVPDHISCIFRPVRYEDVMRSGSKGIGIRLSLGCRATVSEREDNDLRIAINGQQVDARITASAVRYITDKGFDIDLIHQLPLEQGFGTSASGTYAATLCVCSLLGLDRSRAIEATHIMECTMGGGLGDLLAIESEYGIPIRTVPGAPIITGRTEGSDLNMDDITLIVLDEPLKTDSVLNDPVKMGRITEAGDRTMGEFNGTIGSLFDASNHFSESIGLESPRVREIMGWIRSNGYHVGMCMLGNSMFSDAPYELIKDRYPGSDVFRCSSFSGGIEVTRTE